MKKIYKLLITLRKIMDKLERINLNKIFKNSENIYKVQNIFIFNRIE